MSAKSNGRVAAKGEKRGFFSHLRSIFYAVLSHMGMTLFVAGSSYLLLLLSAYDERNDLFFLIGLVCVLLVLVYFLLCPALGFLLPVISSKVTKRRFTGCWSLLMLMSIGTFLLGFFLQQGQPLALSPVLKPLLDPLGAFAAPLSIYLMLYGGCAFICYTYYAGARMFWPTGLLKMLIGNIVIMVVVYWSTHYAWVNDDNPYLLSLACFVIHFIGLVGALAFGLSKAYVFARSIGGRMKGFFVPLYIFNGIPVVAGILLLLSSFGVGDFVGEFLYFLLRSLPEEAAYKMQEYVSILNHEFVSFFMGLCILLLHGGGILGILAAQGEQCRYCGRYACERTTDTDEMSAVTGRERVTETDTWLSFDRYGYDEHIIRTTDDYETVSGTTRYVVHCFYCGRYLRNGKHHWSITRKTDSNTDQEYQRHIWY